MVDRVACSADPSEAVSPLSIMSAGGVDICVRLFTDMGSIPMRSYDCNSAFFNLVLVVFLLTLECSLLRLGKAWGAS